MNDVVFTGPVVERLRGSATLPGLLDAAFDAFEAIRIVARSCEDTAPEVFATFLTAAGTAVEGRNCVMAAPSLPASSDVPPVAVPAPVPADDAGRIAAELAELARLLASRLLAASVMTTRDGDRACCQHAADAAAEICRLLARGSDASLCR